MWIREDRIKRLEKTISELKDRVRVLENPVLFKDGDKVSVQLGKEWINGGVVVSSHRHINDKLVFFCKNEKILKT